MQIPDNVRTLVKANGATQPPTIDCGEPAFKIDCGVPIAARGAATAARKEQKVYRGEFPFDQLKSPMPDGRQYSMFIPSPNPKDANGFSNKVGMAAFGYVKSFAPKAKFIRRQVVENGVLGVRVWRTK